MPLSPLGVEIPQAFEFVNSTTVSSLPAGWVVSSPHPRNEAGLPCAGLGLEPYGVSSWNENVVRSDPLLETPSSPLYASPSTTSPLQLSMQIPSVSTPLPSPIRTPETAASIALDEAYVRQGNQRIPCLWTGCAGSFIDEPSGRSFRQHFAAFHPISRARDVLCGWAGCGQRVQCLAKHVKAHSPERSACVLCGDTLKRVDAVRRHQDSGACTRCPFCSRSLPTIALKREHALICSQRLRK
jgi:ferredoxin